ncbi:MAG: DMT family transporter [Pseudomonadota bacterium]|nr:DMT family transporter [Pseudomonadota bacterium]
MDTRRPIGLSAVAMMVGVCAIWGFQQIALKHAAPDMTPMLQIGLRSGAAALLVAALMHWRGEPLLALADGSWRPGLVVGLLFGSEFLMIGEGLRHTTASHMVVFLYTAPIFAALGLHRRLPAERLAPLQWVGVGLAFGGIAIAFFGGSGGHAQHATGSSGTTLWGDLLALLAGLTWGTTTVVVRCSRLATIPASRTLLYQLLGAFVLLLAAAFAFGQAGIRPSPMLWANLAFQTVVVAFASYLLWFWMLRRYVASQLGVFSFMTPLFGVAFGVWLLNEPLEPGFVSGAVLVGLGIVLVSGHRLLQQGARSLMGSAPS